MALIAPSIKSALSINVCLSSSRIFLSFSWSVIRRYDRVPNGPTRDKQWTKIWLLCMQDQRRTGEVQHENPERSRCEFPRVGGFATYVGISTGCQAVGCRKERRRKSGDLRVIGE